MKWGKEGRKKKGKATVPELITTKGSKTDPLRSSQNMTIWCGADRCLRCVLLVCVRAQASWMRCVVLFTQVVCVFWHAGVCVFMDAVLIFVYPSVCGCVYVFASHGCGLFCIKQASSGRFLLVQGSRSAA